MKGKQHRTRLGPQCQMKNTRLALTVEALEPRLPLSAPGFGFGAAGEPLDSHVRDRDNRDTYRPALIEQTQDDHDSLRFELSDRHPDQRDANSSRVESHSPKPGRDVHARGLRPHKPFSADVFDPELRDSNFEQEAAESPNHVESGLVESTFPTYEFEDLSSYESVHDISTLNLNAESSIPGTTVVFVSLAPTISPTHSNDSLSFGQPTTRLTQPPRIVFDNSGSSQSGLGATLPVSAPVSSLGSSRVSPTTPEIGSPIFRPDPASSDRDAVLVQSASEFTRITEPGIETFVALATNEFSRWWNSDGESFEDALESSTPLAVSLQPSAAIQHAVDSLVASAGDRGDWLSEELLWGGVTEGGFIEVHTEAADKLRGRFELLEDAKDTASTKQLSSQTLRDAFWFDFCDTRLELMFDSTAAEEMAEEQALANAADSNEETWLQDDGGMIVLTSSQFIDQAVEGAVDDAPETSSTCQSTAVEKEIPMDVGIDVFRAIEVAAVPIEQQGSGEASGSTSVPVEHEFGADADSLPSSEQAVKKSKGRDTEPSRAASLLVAVSAFFSHGRKNRTRIVERLFNV